MNILPDLPEDIAEEEALAARLRAEPGLFKRRNAAPNVFVMAWRTPGRLATQFLLVVTYLIGLGLYVAYLGPERAQSIPGIVHCVVLALLVIPSSIMAHAIWKKSGVNVRNVVRICIRAWPLSLFVMLMLLKLISDTLNGPAK